MSTVPPEPGPAARAGAGGYDRAQASHLQRQVAEGFGAGAGRYDRARPTYPADLVERIIAASPGREVLDVGCGTGIDSARRRRWPGGKSMAAAPGAALPFPCPGCDGRPSNRGRLLLREPLAAAKADSRPPVKTPSQP